MKRLEVEFLDGALGDLDDIFIFVMSRSASDAVADGFVSRLLDTCDGIGDAPRAGRPRDDLEPGLRTVSFERRVLIAYKIENDLVLVVNLFYRGRDVDAHFAGLGARSGPS